MDTKLRDQRRAVLAEIRAARREYDWTRLQRLYQRLERLNEERRRQQRAARELAERELGFTPPQRWTIRWH
jgi:hypothetical protein